MRFVRKTVFNGLSAAVDQTSAAIPAEYLIALSAICKSTGTSTGTVKFQASNDDPNVAGKPSLWVDIPSQTVAITANATFIIPKFEVCYQFVRVLFVKNNEQAGTITVELQGLGF